MIIIDYIFIIITVIYSILGLLRGFSKQLISFIVWIIFLFIVFNYFSLFIRLISSYITLDDTYIRIIGIVLLILSTILIIFLLNLTLSKIIASVLFENSNRILGLFMALIKSQIYILIFVLIVIDTPFSEKFLDQSKLTPYYLYFIEYIFNYDDSLFNTFKI